MERRDLNRMFDALAPTSEQEQAVLSRLLLTERKGKPMKKLKKLTVIGIAAALMVISCAAAVVTGIDKRLIDYFGASPEQAELLAPCALPVDVTVEDNGAALHISQVLMDRYSILVLADFTAPEGTVLDLDLDLDGEYGGRFQDFWGFSLLDQAGEPIRLNQSWSTQTNVLDDGDPLDNHLTLLLQMWLGRGIRPDREIGGLFIPAKNLVQQNLETQSYDTVYPGDWSCQVPIPWRDMGQSMSLNQTVGQIDGVDIAVTEVYLSPMTLQLHMEHDYADLFRELLQVFDADDVTLTAKDGKTVLMAEYDPSANDVEQNWSFRLNEIIDPSQFQGGTLTLNIGGESVDIPLDELVPAE